MVNSGTNCPRQLDKSRKATGRSRVKIRILNMIHSLFLGHTNVLVEPRKTKSHEKGSC